MSSDGERHGTLDGAVRSDALTLLSPWLTRRSVGPRHLEAPGPSVEEVALLLEAADHAPDHGRLRPWRFRVLNNEARARLAQAFVRYRENAGGGRSTRDAELEAQRALAGPCLISLAARIDERHVVVPPHEQWIAVGAALGNLMAAANALGYSGKILSGARTCDEGVRGMACHQCERLVGFIYLGTPRLADSAARLQAASPKIADPG